MKIHRKKCGLPCRNEVEYTAKALVGAWLEGIARGRFAAYSEVNDENTPQKVRRILSKRSQMHRKECGAIVMEEAKEYTVRRI